MRLIKEYILSILILTICIFAHGQVRSGQVGKASNQLTVSLYDGAIINGLNITNTTYPNPIRAHQVFTNNFKAALDFERRTTKNLILGFGVEYGTMPVNFDLVYESFDFVDTTQALKAASAKSVYRNSTKYAALRFTIGYSFPLNIGNQGNYRLDAKAIVGKKFCFNGGQLTTSLVADYVSGDTIYMAHYKAMKMTGRWGNQDIKLHGPAFTEYNIGLRKRTNKSILGDLYLGLYAACDVSMYQSGSEGADVEVSNYHYLNGKQTGMDMDYFSTRNFTVGIRLGFGIKL